MCNEMYLHQPFLCWHFFIVSRRKLLAKREIEKAEKIMGKFSRISWLEVEFVLIVNERQSFLVPPSSSFPDILPRRHIQWSGVSHACRIFTFLARSSSSTHYFVPKHLFIALKLTVPNFRLLNSSFEFCCVRAKIYFFLCIFNVEYVRSRPFKFKCIWASAKLSQTFLRRDIIRVHFRMKAHKMNTSWWSEMKFNGNYVWHCRFEMLSRHIDNIECFVNYFSEGIALSDANSQSDVIVNWLNAQRQITRNREGFSSPKRLWNDSDCVSRKPKLWTNTNEGLMKQPLGPQEQTQLRYKSIVRCLELSLQCLNNIIFNTWRSFCWLEISRQQLFHHFIANVRSVNFVHLVLWVELLLFLSSIAIEYGKCTFAQEIGSERTSVLLCSFCSDSLIDCNWFQFS